MQVFIKPGKSEQTYKRSFLSQNPTLITAGKGFLSSQPFFEVAPLLKFGETQWF